MPNPFAAALAAAFAIAPLRSLLAALAVASLLVGLAAFSPIVLLFACAAALLSVWLSSGRTNVRLLSVVAALAMTSSACALFKNVGKDVKQCAGKVISEAQWSDLRPAADDALHLDWSGALAQLEELAIGYGAEFVKCVVAELHDQYAAKVADAGQSDPPDAGQPSQITALAEEYRQSAAERALANAKAYLATH